MTPILKDGKTAIPDDAIASVKKNYVALKGPLAVCLYSPMLEMGFAKHDRRPPSARATSLST